MRIISTGTLRAFWQHYPDSEKPLKNWLREALSADWVTPKDVKERFASASVVAGNRIVFNIAGNKYRLIVKFNYAYRVGYVRFIGTHTQYDRIDAEQI